MSTVSGGCQSSWRLVDRDTPLKVAKAGAGFLIKQTQAYLMEFQGRKRGPGFTRDWNLELDSSPKSRPLFCPSATLPLRQFLICPSLCTSSSLFFLPAVSSHFSTCHWSQLCCLSFLIISLLHLGFQRKILNQRF